MQYVHVLVQLDQNGDLIEAYSVMNYFEDRLGEMQNVNVGTYDSGKLTLKLNDVVWPGNTTDLPRDTPGTLLTCFHCSGVVCACMNVATHTAWEIRI